MTEAGLDVLRGDRGKGIGESFLQRGVIESPQWPAEALGRFRVTSVVPDSYAAVQSARVRVGT